MGVVRNEQGPNHEATSKPGESEFRLESSGKPLVGYRQGRSTI